MSEYLRARARARVGFKNHLLAYLVSNLFVWVLFYLTGGGGPFPWPMWMSIGWGTGVLSHYVSAYQPIQIFSEEKEYQRLQRKLEL